MKITRFYYEETFTPSPGGGAKNLKVLLDGDSSLWVTSKYSGTSPGEFKLSNSTDGIGNGDEVIDKVTGFTGTVVARLTKLHGEDLLLVVPLSTNAVEFQKKNILKP